jgi:hypothetical protein
LSWDLIGDVAFFVATASTIIFALLYVLLAPWWKTSAGRNIMAVMGTMALAFGYFTWSILVGGARHSYMPMRALIFLAIASSVTWRTVIFVKHHIIRSLADRKESRNHELEDAR